MSFNILKIKELIKRKKLTYKEVAEILNVTERTIINYINEKTKIDAYTLEKFAKALGVPVGYFFDEPAAGVIQNGIINNSNGVNHGNVSIEISQQAAEIRELKAKLEGCEKENVQLKERLKEKDEIINLLKNR